MIIFRLHIRAKRRTFKEKSERKTKENLTIYTYKHLKKKQQQQQQITE